jgi:aspartyl-tRNA(Asn)/glutamyl-tRNA(Gln) amidotransferase subunit C
MAKMTKDDVEHVAKLAKLTLSASEVNKFQKQLSSIVNYTSELNEVDTSGVIPTSQTTGLTNVFRPDEIKNESLSRDQALSGTENTHNGYFKVGRIIKK